jgi:hypothetical protein
MGVGSFPAFVFDEFERAAPSNRFKNAIPLSRAFFELPTNSAIGNTAPIEGCSAHGSVDCITVLSGRIGGGRILFRELYSLRLYAPVFFFQRHSFAKRADRHLAWFSPIVASRFERNVIRKLHTPRSDLDGISPEYSSVRNEF